MRRKTSTTPSSSSLVCRGSVSPGMINAIKSWQVRYIARRTLRRLGPFSATNSPRHHASLRVIRSSSDEAKELPSRDQYLPMSIKDNFRPEGIGNITPPQGVRMMIGAAAGCGNPTFGDQPSRAKSIQLPLPDRCNNELSTALPETGRSRPEGSSERSAASICVQRRKAQNRPRARDAVAHGWYTPEWSMPIIRPRSVGV